MNRTLQPEILDELPSSDPRALHARRDLRRINALMGNGRFINQFVEAEVRRLNIPSPLRIVELGAGDGNISHQLADHLRAQGHAIQLTPIDQNPCAADVIRADVFEWLPTAPSGEVIIANLFLHHFQINQLRKIFEQSAPRCKIFAAAEPRRNAIAAWFARRVNLIGCNEVTVHDADISVRAGFNGAELSTLWPQGGGWRLTERRAGLFTHFFGGARDT